ncbi:MAG: MFS transporter [Anaerorhabdus sp.]
MKGKYSDVMKEKNFSRYLVANVISRFGDAVDSIAIPYLVYQITGSAALMAILAGLNFIPNIVLQPFSGVLVDYFSKKKIQLICNLGRAVAVIVVMLLYLTAGLQLWHLVVFTLFNSTMESFQMPASSALVQLILSEEKYSAGLSLKSSLISATELVGVGLAGIIIAYLGIEGALIIDGTTFVICALLMGSLNYPPEELIHAKINLDRYFSDLKAGLNYIKTKRVVVFVCILAAAVNFFTMPFNSLYVAYVEDILLMGPEGLAVVSMSLSVGMLLGSMAYPKLVEKMNEDTMLRIFGILVSLLLCGVVLGSLQSSLIMKYIVMSLSIQIAGFSLAIINLLAQITFTKQIDKNYMGRCSAVLGAICVCAMPISSFITASLTQVASMSVILCVGAIASALTFIIMSYRSEAKQM